MRQPRTISHGFGRGVTGALLLLLLASTIPSLSATAAALTQPADTPAPVHGPAAGDTVGLPKRDERVHRLAHAIADDLARVEPYLERYGYWAVFAAVAVEGVGIPAPGQTLLEAGAIVAAAPNSRLDIHWLLFVAILATTLGQALGYLIGRSGGRALLNRLPVSAGKLERMERGFNRYGGWLVFFGRFVDGPRQLAGLFSGVLAMPWRRFMLLNVGGAICWASFWALGVYYLDLHFDALVTALRQLNPWIAGLTLLGIAALLLLLLAALLRQRRRTGSD
jgi:membrane protein DedA with SNARE-associated domain